LALILLPLVLIPLYQSQAQDYDGAEEEIFLSRSPSFTQQTLDSDIRLRSMGHLTIPIDDESNLTGIFKYGQHASGLPLDYEQGKVEVSYYYESGLLKDLDTKDSSFLGSKFESKQGVLTGMEVFVSTQPNGKAAFGVGYARDDNDAVYSSGLEDAQGIISLENNPGLSGLSMHFGQQIGKTIFGVSYRFQETDLVDRVSIATAPSFLSIHTRLRQKDMEIFPSVGMLLSGPGLNEFSFSMGPRFKKREIDNDFSSFLKIKNELEGTIFDAGFIYRYGEEVEAGFFASSGNMEGDQDISTSFTASQGKSKLNQTQYNFNSYYKPEASQVSFGLLYEWIIEKSRDHDSTGTLTEHVEQINSSFGLGLARSFSNEKGLLGFEYRFLETELKDELDLLDPDTNELSDGYQLSFGGEFRLIDRVILRAGVFRKNISEDPAGIDPELETRTREFDMGAEYQVNNVASVALAYAHTKITSDTVGTALDAHEFSADSLNLLLKYRMGR